jgi:hypothetical protein
MIIRSKIPSSYTSAVLSREEKTIDFANTLETAKRILGEENAFTLRLMNNLSEVMRQGSFEVAENERQSVHLEALGL